MVPPTGTPTALLERLGSPRLLVLSGKGGVGRTTAALLLGRALANQGARVLVATTGHDDRLAWMTGRAELAADPVDVGGGVSIQRLVPHRCLAEYAAMTIRSPKLAKLVFGNETVRRLLHAVPGLDDFAVLGKVWHEAMRARDYDVVLFDGPATGHLRYALSVPQAIVDAVPDGPLRREAGEMQAHLRDPAVAAVYVSLPELWPLTELEELATDLRDGVGVRPAAVVINGAWPSVPAPPASVSTEPMAAEVHAQIAKAAEVGARHAQQLEQWTNSAELGRCLQLHVPWRFAGVSGPADVAELAGQIASAEREATPDPQEDSP